MERTCTQCKHSLDVSNFYKVGKYFQSMCKSCFYKYNKKYRANNILKTRLYNKTHRDKNKERIYKYRKHYAENNVEKIKNLQKNYREKNKDKMSAWSALRRCSCLQRTPKWLTKDDHWLIKEIYHLAKLRKEMFGFDWHVDHIIPLRAKNVSGLHVPNNLRVIPAKENLRKYNKFIESEL